MNQDPVIQINNFKLGESDEMLETSTRIMIADNNAKMEKALAELSKEFRKIKEKSNFRIEEQELHFGENDNDFEKIVDNIKAENIDSLMEKYNEIEELYRAVENDEITISEFNNKLEEKKKELQFTRLEAINSLFM